MLARLLGAADAPAVAHGEAAPASRRARPAPATAAVAPARPRRRPRRVRPAPAARDPALALVETLTEREVEVLEQLARHLTNKEIAAELNISPLTVKRHVSNLCGKLGAGTRRQAVAIAAALGLLPARSAVVTRLSPRCVGERVPPPRPASRRPAGHGPFLVRSGRWSGRGPDYARP